VDGQGYRLILPVLLDFLPRQQSTRVKPFLAWIVTYIAISVLVSSEFVKKLM
jgi:hypothetical protein